MDPLINQSRGAPGATLLFALMLAASLYTLFKQPALIERHLLRPYWLWRQRTYWTLITSAFLHADLAHLFFNAFTFWAFAFSLERVIGTAPFLALYLAGLLLADAATCWRQRDNPQYGSLGASGAISAVLFASIAYFPTQGIYILPIPVAIPAPWFAIGYLVYSGYAARQAGGRINHDAHFAGAVAGVAFVALTDPQALAGAWRALVG